MDGWTLGFTIGLAVVVVVVLLLLTMIVFARRLNRKAEAILEALHAAHDNTNGLWQLPATNAAAQRILAGAAAARQALHAEEDRR